MDGLRADQASSMRDGREVADGEVGELFSRTPYVFDGYWKNPEKTAEAFRGAWCSVGDMARRDEDGYYHLVDRKSNMIISGGENIYPSEVEGMLGAPPGGARTSRSSACPTTSGAKRCTPWWCCTTGEPPPRPRSSTGAATASPATSGRARSCS